MKEKVLLAIVDLKVRGAWPIEDVTHEMTELVKACQGEVVGTIICPAHPPTAATLIHSGKVLEVAELARSLNAEAVIFSEELKGVQQRNLEEAINLKTIDRTAFRGWRGIMMTFPARAAASARSAPVKQSLRWTAGGSACALTSSRKTLRMSRARA